MKRGYTRSVTALPVAPEPDPAMVDLLRASILHQDDHLLVINKPAGLAVHPGPRTAESLELYTPFLALDRKRPPQPAHRLDRDTSGCLALGRTPGSIRQLSAWFSDRAIGKSYLAIVDGVLDQPAGTVEAPLLKTSSAGGGWRMITDPNGQPAVTRWRVVAAGAGQSLLLLEPQTGRTHQLRVHCAHIGHPIAGDPVYGQAIPARRMYLHASRISLPTLTGSTLDITAPLPADWPPVFSGQMGIGKQ